MLESDQHESEAGPGVTRSLSEEPRAGDADFTPTGPSWGFRGNLGDGQGPQLSNSGSNAASPRSGGY